MRKYYRGTIDKLLPRILSMLITLRVISNSCCSCKRRPACQRELFM